MGSVKDIMDLGKDNHYLMFTFSDRYSVFDWGEMPDKIPYKGAALCLQSAYFFELLESDDLFTHYMGLLTGSDPNKLTDIDEIVAPTDAMLVEKVKVIHPRKTVIDGKVQYDYSDYSPGMGGILIPLELIYRNGLPEGSSMLDKLRSGKLNPTTLGFPEGYVPKAGDRLPKPLYEPSTKLEDGDRILTWDEAQRIAALRNDEKEALLTMMQHANGVISKKYKAIGLINEDGKFEVGRNKLGLLTFVDVLGTLDECRLTYEGTQVSKEILRQWYKKHQPEWVAEVKAAKDSGAPNWRELVKTKPAPLPTELVRSVGTVYAAVTDALLGRSIFGASPLKEAVDDYKKYAESLR